MVIVLLLCCRFIVKPATLSLNALRETAPEGILQRVLHRKGTVLIVHSAILFGMVTGATYAGTSNLFASYLAGASISWWDAEVPHVSIKDQAICSAGPERVRDQTEKAQQGQHPLRVDNGCEYSQARNFTLGNQTVEVHQPESTKHGGIANLEGHCKTNSLHLTGSNIYEACYLMAVQRILKPLFFVSTDHIVNAPFHLTFSHLGIHRFCRPYYTDVFWTHCMARYSLCRPDGCWKDNLRALARAIYYSTVIAY